jgi:hypothetical protein
MALSGDGLRRRGAGPRLSSEIRAITTCGVVRREVAELSVLKEPSEPSYLSDWPARQKGFKKPPP